MPQTVILTTARNRRLAHDLIDRAPVDAVVMIKEGNRTLDQNALMWALLSDIARAKPEGRVWPTEVWKSAFMSALGYEILWQPGLEGSPPFPAGFRTSRLSKAAMSELIELIYSYGARHGVKWSEANEHHATSSRAEAG